MADGSKYRMLDDLKVAMKRNWEFQRESIGQGTQDLLARGKALLTGEVPIVERDLGMEKGKCSVRYTASRSYKPHPTFPETTYGSVAPLPKEEAIAAAKAMPPAKKPLIRCQP